MGVLSSIRGPRDLKSLSADELDQLAAEIRGFLVDAVSRAGGHLGPNLGAVELTIALHRVFDSPADRIVFDVGHQAYVHKLLTGRQDFSRLRQEGGLSGYPSRAESAHDIVENQHASVSLSWAEGLAKAYRLTEQGHRHVAAVIGDGALTGGTAWEALNNIAADPSLPLVIVVNDNGHSYSPTIGGLATHLATLRTTDGYEQFLQRTRDILGRTPVVGRTVYEALHGAKKGLKDFIAPQGLFEDLGLKYVGPVDGHDRAAVEQALLQAKRFAGPVIVHCITEKGRGYALAEQADERFHQVKAIDPDTGTPVQAADGDWTSVFADEMVRLGARRQDVVAITAAMLRSAGLEPFAQHYPGRVFDVGIAEQHAAALAAGLATGGLHPVVAVYATFLNRCFDQVLMDVALHHCGVTFVLDRAGITGDDGASHNGMWDLALLQVVPGLRIAAPRDGEQLREQLREATAVDDAPTVLRYPKGTVGAPVPAVGRISGMDVLRAADDVDAGANSGALADVLVVSVGALAPLCLEVAERLAEQGITTTVVDPRWVKPVDEALPGLAARHRLVVSVEDGVRVGGVGAAIAQALRDSEIEVPVRNFGVPAAFWEHASRHRVLAAAGLTASDIAREVTGTFARLAQTDQTEAPTLP
ncbi:1-deoxy-D-xylulose-5-phosphate synthase [Streptomyces sp. NBC_00365]|uniref:1-deoxy-D-xylulose-5-phosphate synthase n=1 Tax=Streptomyces sp. NBC_00365 TaxID=2975726 RepID=UPI00225BA8F3|nr:1-deoxy-D-xylulose-5-phosphate synthase [Streptomyces sp. NBC_00365]MCX5087491.1 1-deoxy-D-xylulose-5-phosphate synthase [Streptomyces sp. NBC_00365]